jgi:endonuclease YncB( thermonuclease family)
MLKPLALAMLLCGVVSAQAAPDKCGMWEGYANWNTYWDGDTVTIGGVKTRLWGLDAEEMNEPNGSMAKKALRWIIADHKVRCLTAGKSYDRTVGQCFLIDLGEFDWAKDVAYLMVTRGYALGCAHYGGSYENVEPDGARDKLIQKPYCGGEPFGGLNPERNYKYCSGIPIGKQLQ